MIIGAPREVFEGEKRVALTPQSAIALGKLGYSCAIEAGAGEAARFSDAAYRAAGVEVLPSAADLWARADVVAKVRPPEPAEMGETAPRLEPEHHAEDDLVALLDAAVFDLIPGQHDPPLALPPHAEPPRLSPRMTPAMRRRLDGEAALDRAPLPEPI